MTKRKIRELIVVEGRHDIDKLQRLFDAVIVSTGGLGLDEQTLKTVQQADKTNGVIILTDPDQPGRKIRDELSKVAPNARHVFIERKDAIGKRNVGIEYVDDQILAEAMEKTVTFAESKDEITRSQYLALGLDGDSRKRDFLTEKLHIGKCNNKRLLKYLNMMDVSYDRLKEICDEYRG